MERAAALSLPEDDHWWLGDGADAFKFDESPAAKEAEDGEKKLEE